MAKLNFEALARRRDAHYRKMRPCPFTKNGAHAWTQWEPMMIGGRRVIRRRCVKCHKHDKPFPGLLYLYREMKARRLERSRSEEKPR